MFYALQHVRTVFRRITYKYNLILKLFVFFLLLEGVFLLTIMEAESLSLGDALYFSMIVASTVGFGDISPATPFGRVMVVLFIFGALLFFPTIFSLIAQAAVERAEKRLHGAVPIRKKLDILITGGFEDKQKRLFENLLLLDPALSIGLLHEYDKKPVWISEMGQSYFRGSVSDPEAFRLAGGFQSERILLLVDDPDDFLSNGKTLLAADMLETLGYKGTVISERVVYTEFEHQVRSHIRCLPVSRAGVIAYELLQPGSFDFLIAIFSNRLKGNQYNRSLDTAAGWKVVKSQPPYPVGYRIAGQSWQFFADGDATLPAGTEIKYFSNSSPNQTKSLRASLLIIGNRPQKALHIAREYLADSRFGISRVTLMGNLQESDIPHDLQGRIGLIPEGGYTEQALRGAGADSVDNIILLAESVDSARSDERNYLLYNTLRYLNPHAFVFIEVLNPDHPAYALAQNARFEEISQPGQIVQELHDPGAMALLAHLLDSGTDERFRTAPLPEGTTTYGELRNRLIAQNAWLIGCRHGEEWGFLCQDSDRLPETKGDMMYIAAKGVE